MLKRFKRYIKEFLLSPYSTNRKRINFFKTFVSWKVLKKTELDSYPLKLTICPGNVCNLKCPLCPTGKREQGRKQGWMSIDTFTRIMNECGPYLYEVDLYNWGEPLLNKDIMLMIRKAKEYKIKVNISTNLNYFTKDLGAELITSGTDRIIISLAGASQETLEKYQVGSNFSKVLENIKLLVNLKQNLKLSKPFIQWRYLINRFNEHEVHNAKSLAKELELDELDVGPLRCDMGNELLFNKEERYENVRKWLPSRETRSIYNYDHDEKKIVITRLCHYLWTQSTINWDGSVSPCCSVWHEQYDFGNINRNTFKEIWNNEYYKSARNEFIEESSSDKLTICHICKVNEAQH